MLGRSAGRGLGVGRPAARRTLGLASGGQGRGTCRPGGASWRRHPGASQSPTIHGTQRERGLVLGAVNVLQGKARVERTHEAGDCALSGLATGEEEVVSHGQRWVTEQLRTGVEVLWRFGRVGWGTLIGFAVTGLGECGCDQNGCQSAGHTRIEALVRK